jgi:hypothetical protein
MGIRTAANPAPKLIFCFAGGLFVRDPLSLRVLKINDVLVAISLRRLQSLFVGLVEPGVNILEHCDKTD